MNSSVSTSARATRFSLVLASLSLGAAMLSLSGWAFNIQRFADWDMDGIAQMPNNAVALSSAAAGLLCWLFGKRWSARGLAAFAALIAIATVFEHATGISLGIDTLIFYRSWGQRGTVVHGRMGLPGSVALTIVGISILLATYRRWKLSAPIAGLATMAIAMLSLIGYILRADPLYTIPRYTSIALQTSTMLLVLGAALVASVPEIAPMRLILGDSAAAMLVRRAIPAAILLPVLIGWLRVKGQHAGLYDTAFGTAVLVLTLIMLLVVLLWWAAADVERHERAMRESRDQLAAILGSITDAFVTIDPDWRIRFVNEKAELQLGKPRPALVGQSLWDVIPTADGEDPHLLLRSAMAQRISVEYDTYYPAWGRWFANHAYPTANGGLSIYARDITEQKRAEEALRESEHKFSLLFDKAAFVAGLTSIPDGTFVDVNEAFTRTFGYPREAVIGRSGAELGISFDDTSRATLQEKVDREGSIRDLEIKLRVRGGQEHTFLTNVSTIELGGRRYRLTTMQDITERKAAEEALRSSTEALVAADRMKDEFLATLSHELRTPLTAIVGWSQLMMNAALDPREQMVALESIRSSAKAQAQLIEDVLDVSRIITGKMRLSREETDVAGVIEAAVATVRPAAEAKGIRLRLNLDPDVPHLFIDPERIRQIAWNLLSNSIKFSSQGTVEITLRREEDSYTIEVSDEGRGISREFLPHVFERFRQADSSASRPHEGLGLGLALAKDLVELHGGSISVESEEGRGSRFTVRLPLSSARPLKEPRPAMPTPAATLHGLRVLYVDDRDDARLLIGTMLRQHGADVVEAGSVDEALLILSRDPMPRIVVTDLAMPGRDGYDLLAAIRADSRWDHVPVLALTAEGRSGDQAHASSVGFRDFLRKPIESHDLAAAVARAMSDRTENARVN